MADQKSLLEVALEIMNETSDPVNIYELIEKVLERKGITDTDGSVAAKLYTDIIVSSSFVFLSKENLWDLKSRQSLKLFDEDGYVSEALDDEDYEDEDSDSDDDSKEYTTSEDENADSDELDDQDSEDDNYDDTSYEAEEYDEDEDDESYDDTSLDEEKYNKYMDDYEKLYED
ncbi:MAG: DNA-directed RNA polymerase subunit delta [Acholeplasmatales bacterium]|nr:DNA-directed RNA polymerase subunit delta [Acholeplasmatales bacterium]